MVKASDGDEVVESDYCSLLRLLDPDRVDATLRPVREDRTTDVVTDGDVCTGRRKGGGRAEADLDDESGRDERATRAGAFGS